MIEVYPGAQERAMTPTPNDQPKQEAADEQRQLYIQYHPPQMPGGGPPCIWDNGPTMKTGSCYTCIICGSTSSCG